MSKRQKLGQYKGIKLAPCPWCQKAECFVCNTQDSGFSVACQCGAGGPEGHTKMDAVRKWNSITTDLTAGKFEVLLRKALCPTGYGASLTLSDLLQKVKELQEGHSKTRANMREAVRLLQKVIPSWAG